MNFRGQAAIGRIIAELFTEGPCGRHAKRDRCTGPKQEYDVRSAAITLHSQTGYRLAPSVRIWRYGRNLDCGYPEFRLKARPPHFPREADWQQDVFVLRTLSKVNGMREIAIPLECDTGYPM